MTRIPRILTIAPGGGLALRLLAASARTGALGLFDLGAGPDMGLADVAGALRRVGDVLAGRRFGVRIGVDGLGADLLGRFPASVSLVVVGGRADSDWPGALASVRAAGRAAMAEVSGRDAAGAALEAGFDLLMVAGQEAGGWVGDETSLALLQAVLERASDDIRVWVRGVGPALAAASVAAGAAGVVLDGALLLARESPLSGAVRAVVATWDGVETTLLGRPGGRRFRAFLPRGSAAATAPEEVDLTPRSGFLATVGWGEGQVWPAGQDAALAAGLAAQHVTVGGIVQAVEAAIEEALPASSPATRSRRRRRRARPSDVAIIGMSALVPGASDVRGFWQNTLGGRDAITEVAPDRWDWRLYYDADPKAPDKIISRWGGFVPEIPFDPLTYGMPPTSLPSIEPLHLLTLEAVRAALDDAGYRDRSFPRERTAVVLGAGGGAAQLAMGYAFRSYLPLLDTVAPGLGTEALARAGHLLPEWTEDSFPGILLNVAAGRVANRFDLGGANYTVDAACGSSLAAAALAVRELESGAADVVVLGGADTVQNPFTYLAFSKTQAFSPRGRCRPFDATADGIVISEAVAVLILKRLADAERDGDRIYAVIKGLGAGGDGRAKGLTAPRREGQVRAMERAYEKAGVSPADVGYVEAHGTGTAAGDVAEVQALTDVFAAAGTPRGRCAVGSVKSLIGHTKCAAGLAGLINASLALHHRVFPPTIGVETPNPRVNFPESPFHVSRTARPWMRHDPARPRRAGVSAFGFGGTNFHAVLEAYEGDPSPPPPPRLQWPAELLAWRADDRATLIGQVEGLDRALAGPDRPALREIAHTLAARGATGGLPTSASSLQTLVGKPPVAPGQPSATAASLAIVATSLDDLRTKLRGTLARLRQGDGSFHDPAGVIFSDRARAPGDRVAFLFPGQGSQYPGMLEELAIAIPSVLDTIEEVDRALAGRGRAAVGPIIYPPLAWDDEESARQRQALAGTDVAQPALGAVDTGVLRLLGALGLRADLLGGHSYGELVALHAAGVYPLEALAELSEARGRFLLEAAGGEPGAMAALAAGPAVVDALLAGVPGVVVANRNGPAQTVVSGPRDAITRVIAAAQAQQVRASLLPVACAFHSPLIAAAREPLARLAAALAPQAPRIPVYSNLDAAPYPSDPATIPSRLGAHATSEVRFAAMVEAMHEAGARVFVEVGPGNVLTSLVDSILGDRPHLAVSVDPPGRRGVAGLLGALARLFAAGLALDLRPLTADRATRVVAWDSGRFEPATPALSPTTWLVDGNRARPAFGPEPARFGSGPALPVPAGQPSWSPAVAPAVPPAAIPDAMPAGAPPDRVFSAFQQTMRTFLDVQRTTMLQVLAARPASSAAEPGATGGLPTSAQSPGTLVGKPPVAPESLPTSAQEPGILGGQPPAPHGSSHAGNGHAGRDIERRLLDIVRTRTGYPAEMLQLDLDLEADLGIDSIKRVEILGTLRDSIADRFHGSESDLMDQLARARTLGAIVERLEQFHPGPDGHVHRNGDRNGQAHSHPAVEPEPEATPLRRMLVEVVDADDAGHAPARLVAGGAVLVTDDGCGVAARLARRLGREGLRAVVVKHSDSEAGRFAATADGFEVDLGDPGAVGRLGREVRGLALVCGIVHALPLSDGCAAGLDGTAWERRLRGETLGLFTLAREFADDLARASALDGAALIAATALGGTFASVPPRPEDWFPGQGAVAGLVKTLAREWPGVRTRVVDLDPGEPRDRTAARLCDELFTADSRSEVGYVGSRRVALEVVEQGLDIGGPDGFALDEGEPVVITGGARGITAAVAAELAARWRPTLLLVGTSPLPEGSERTDTAGVTDPAALKSLLLDRARRAGAKPSPAELERAYQALRREREIRTNLARLRALGSTVEYAQADVRDAPALGLVLDRWEARFGPPAGLVHGAGVIHDKLIRDKTPESVDRVIGTKLFGALNLARRFDAAPPRFTAFFSSVAGRFGNRGQSDYAAANDALNKLALWLDDRWPGRVVSMIWGPWSGVGMVSDLEGHLGRRGLGMIDPAEGSARLADELRFGRKGEVEVVVAGDLGNLVTPVEAKVAP